MESKLIESLRYLARIASLVSLIVGAYIGLIDHRWQEGEYYLVLAIVLRIM